MLNSAFERNLLCLIVPSAQHQPTTSRWCYMKVEALYYMTRAKMLQSFTVISSCLGDWDQLCLILARHQSYQHANLPSLMLRKAFR